MQSFVMAIADILFRVMDENVLTNFYLIVVVALPLGVLGLIAGCGWRLVAKLLNRGVGQ